MSYFKHKRLIVEAIQFLPDEKNEEFPRFVDTLHTEQSGTILGSIQCGENKVFVYPGDFIVYGEDEKRFVIKEDAFEMFFEQVGR